jgi:hypothetical protein
VILWVVVAGGVILYAVSALGTTREYAGQRVPRLGFWPPRKGSGSLWWTVAGCAGAVLVLLGCNGLTSNPGAWFVLLGTATAISVAAHTAVVVAHNIRVRPANVTRRP